MQAIDALRLQYPDYADALEAPVPAQGRCPFGRDRISTTPSDQMLIGTELHRNLLRDVERSRKIQPHSTERSTLGLKTRELVSAHPLFAGPSAASGKRRSGA